MTNLVYGGSSGTSEIARVEAFVHQVHRYPELLPLDPGYHVSCSSDYRPIMVTNRSLEFIYITMVATQP